MDMNGNKQRKKPDNPARVLNPGRVTNKIKYLTLLIFSLAIALSGCSASKQVVVTDVRGLGMDIRVINLPGSEAGKAKVAFVVEIRHPELLFKKSLQGYTAELELSFTLKERKNKQPVFLKDLARTIHVEKFAETIDRKRLVRVVEYAEVPAGAYTAIVSARDCAADNLARVAKSFVAHDFHNRFTLTGPLLSADSMEFFDTDKLVPKDKNHYTRDIYAFFVFGGLQQNLPLEIEYEIQDESEVALFEGKRILDHPQKITTLSLRIPANKLTIGTNQLSIQAKHGNKKLSASTSFENYLDTKSLTLTAIESFIEPMQYIMDEEDWHVLERAPEAERVERVKAFWNAHKPVPAESENPLLKEFAMRVEEANQRFNWGGFQGWRTDRGRIHILYGPPDEIKREQTSKNTRYEIWRYDEAGRQFVFKDLHGDGDFRLISEPMS